MGKKKDAQVDVKLDKAAEVTNEAEMVRTIFKADDIEFCIERPFDKSMDNNANCSNAVEQLVDGMLKGKVAPVFKLESNAEGKQVASPVFLNLHMLKFIEILHVGLYKRAAPEIA